MAEFRSRREILAQVQLSADKLIPFFRVANRSEPAVTA
jgi:hypothetical protein